MAEKWTVRLDRLVVHNADEDDFWSNGDEPYIVPIGFRSRFRTPNSTSVSWSGVLDDDWASGIDGGESKAIPAGQGTLEFGGVERPTLQQVLGGSMPEIIGAIIVVFESDATPFSAIRSMVEEVRAALRTELRRLIEGGELSLTDPQPDIERAVKNVQQATELSTGEKIALFLQSFGDPDDLVGLRHLVFAAVDSSMGLPVPVLQEQDLNLRFKPSGIDYEIRGRLSVRSDGVGWESLGGTITSDPAAASWGPGRLDVFARGTDTALWHRWYDGSWHNWESLGGILTSAPAVSSWSSGRLDVFVRGTDRALWHKWFDNGWHDWESLGGGLSSGSAAASWGAGRVDVFVRGDDNALWHKWFDGSWHNWESLGGVLTSAPGVAAWGSGRLDVVVRGTDNACWHKWFDGGWHDWESLGGQFSSGLDVASWGSGRLDLVGRGLDNACWHSWFDNGWS
ncbi:MAG TPA: hypothetical protein VNT31_08775 [Nocardioides sp.]|nr:hypothetical protein [Nocardioides sp.]